MLLTFDAALTLYSIAVADARELLMEYQTTDCAPAWKLHAQEHEVAVLTHMRDRIKIIHDKMADKHISRK